MRNKHLYPENWKTIAQACKERAGYRCEHCGVIQGTERISKRGNPYRVWLHACHVDHTARHDPNAKLLCLCVVCHWWFDFSHWQRSEITRLERLKHRKLLERRGYQLTEI